ncbi:hypothetical protein OTU49_016476, partial [Cherax quadricarinatus]
MGSGFMGDIAVDDIIVAAGSCVLRPSEASNGINYTTPLTPTPQPPTSQPSSIYDCSFDQDLCIWTSDYGAGTGNEMKWEVHEANDISDGGYAYLDITKTVNPYARGVMNSTEIS